MNLFRLIQRRKPDKKHLQEPCKYQEAFKFHKSRISFLKETLYSKKHSKPPRLRIVDFRVLELAGSLAVTNMKAGDFKEVGV